MGIIHARYSVFVVKVAAESRSLRYGARYELL